MSVKNITDQEFAAETAKGTVLVDFWAPWCGPCQVQGPILDDLARRVGDEARIVKVNVDDNPEAPSRFGVASIPNLVLLKDGDPIRRFVGLQRVDVLEAAIRMAS